MKLTEGTLVDSYRVKHALGQGITSTVYLAWDNSKSVPVALKLLDEHLAKDAGVVKMFKAEAQAGLLVDHLNIIKTMGAGTHKGQPYIAFEYVTGNTLEEYLERGPLTEAQSIYILRHATQALRHLFQKQVVHQDLKPENILISHEGVCKLVDLGFSRVPGGIINWDGYAAGSAFYMSPEQCQPQKGVPIDCRADIYALGATIYHAATGAPPFVAEDDEVVREMQIKEPLTPAGTRNPSLHADFSDVLTRMLQKDPRARYQTPEELLLDLRHLEIKGERLEALP